MPTPTFPITEKFSDVTSASFGYCSGEVRIKTSIGFIPVPATLTREEVIEAAKFFVEAAKFAELSEEDRQRIGVD